ncbi:LEAF RUST 10 DISEASE-RESISTANCE LOCUS RECEPTOR-LIKE PROTEIN KINASE-like 2.2 isoform X2 [Prunus persica]|uniref:LEAF RUST 10 DISEASE-RESISTANCE LOCUS RECEPTOR-LIKE PROTEIN KINASE-like 2.2 isoform X2 n=1 Tax=Prunus persica TaxID=3760 RepID=UPI0009AB2D2A|nr:LEAF RUST 10 DISEASE-RESISTANCE LOCUS RECEPTOR-LIKE PROTEIN KINASE-like 2.2 isoform X2 [Prunus persica]
MGSRSLALSRWVLIVAFLVVGLARETCNAKDESTKCTSSCGNIHNISYPFRLKHDPKHCGNVKYTLSCENDNTLVDVPSSGRYYVRAINYHNQTIRLVDPGLQNNNCSSMPRNFLPGLRFPYSIVNTRSSPLSTPIFYIMCSNPVNSSLYVETAPCLNTSATSLVQQKTYSYVKVGAMVVGDLNRGCSVGYASALLNYSKDYMPSYKSIHSALMYGFELGVYWPYEKCPGQWTSNSKCFPRTIPGLIRFRWEVTKARHPCFAFQSIRKILKFMQYKQFFDFVPSQVFDFVRTFSMFLAGRRWGPLICLGSFFAARLIFGVPCMIVFVIYTWRRRHLSMYSVIEDFLQSDSNFLPIRYSYSEIKKMTNKFKDKLGEGGYGSVFKGKLRSGSFVAIKVLGKPKGNGQDFTSEVATIGRIHHANVVQLIGYCVEGSNRALVFDFMPNSSLDKYIYSKEKSMPLSCKKMYEISLGVARGIEYLHQGCEMQILHFDIKPHNILLDENFNPKISDFGLAKLYSVDDSIVSLTAARGTMGYIAPELFYKNIGGVSYKADVYSFGMLLMEMASRRKNFNSMVERSSQTYFPSWAYDQYNKGNDLEMGDFNEEENKIIKKMVITALWCIQMKPSDRPNMNKVIEMLGGDVECLKMPIRPFLYPQEMHAGDVQENLNSIGPNGELTWTLSGR